MNPVEGRSIYNRIFHFFLNSSMPEPTFRNLTLEEKKHIDQVLRNNPVFAKHLSDTFDNVHDDLLDPDLLSPTVRRQLKKNYINAITQEYIDIPRVQEHDPLDRYLIVLEQALLENLRSKSPVRTQKTTTTTERSSAQTDMDTSLAYLWQVCDRRERSTGITTFFNEMADAHGLIQATGWSTQNENSLLAILDAHNYVRYKSKIAEGHFILRSLADPLYPLFTEYQDIAHREKNVVLKILRTAVPMLITAGFMISMMALMPVALPELAFVILAIPLLYLGLIASSLYVKTKELTYQSYRHLRYHGDLEKFPEFQLNSNLVDAFGQEKALDVRAYYLQAIKTCHAIEDNYRGINRLSTEEKAAREANVEKSHALLLEWFDLRDNKNICRDKAPLIAIKRLETDERALSKTFQTTQQQDERDIKQLALTITNHLREARQPEERERQTPSLRFFPSCLKLDTEIKKIQTLEEQISANLQNMNA